MSQYYNLTKFLKHEFSRFLFFCFVSFVFLNLLFFISAGKVYSGQATLSWDPPTTNADGTPLTDLAGYKIYYGTSSGNYSQTIDVSNVTTYQVNNLSEGLTYYFAATAYDTSNNESSYSNEVNKTIAVPPLGDINQDGAVDIKDLILVAKDFGKTTGFNPGCDLNSDGKVDIKDLIIVAKNFGKK